VRYKDRFILVVFIRGDGDDLLVTMLVVGLDAFWVGGTGARRRRVGGDSFGGGGFGSSSRSGIARVEL